mgnify:CR=1 FL=1
MIRGLLFDLDGVLVNTNPLHARAWQELAEELGIPFTPADQEAFLGISRAQCLEILLKKGNRSLSESEKERLCTRKNDRYREMIGTLTPASLLPIHSRPAESSNRQRIDGVAMAPSVLKLWNSEPSKRRRPP